MSVAAATAALLVGGGAARAQNVAPERGAAALGSTLAGLGTTARVLTVAAHPDDEDTPIIAWLARGRHVETAYLSLTRGDGGQNLIGNELGEALGAIRTQELLSARRIDGGRQYFTRAYDFGFSKNAEETYEHWPKDSILGDVVRVVRAFRPHVMIGFFSGTPRDGHGHHQVSGLLAREAYELAGDTVRYPVVDYGAPWTPQKFYRSARQQPDSATLRVNVGEYDPLLGRSYFEVAAESRSQHKSQGFGVLQRKGAVHGYLRREAARVGPANANAEQSLFEGIDTTWIHLPAALPAAARSAFDSAAVAMRDAKARYVAADPSAIVAPLAIALRQLRKARSLAGSPAPRLITARVGMPPRMRSVPGDSPVEPGLWDALSLTVSRLEAALVLAAGIAVEATAPKATVPVREPAKTAVNDSMPVSITVYNRGRAPVRVMGARADLNQTAANDIGVMLAADSATTVVRFLIATESTSPWWRFSGRRGGDWFLTPLDARDEMQRQESTLPTARAELQIAGVSVTVAVPIVNRFADPIKGDQQVPVHAVPGSTIGLENYAEYIRAGVPVERDLRVYIQSAYPESATVTVSIDLPTGLRADSADRARKLGPFMGAVVTFKVRGTVAEGRHQIGALASHEGTISATGYATVAYDHIAPQRLYGASGLYLSAVEVKLPARARIGYVVGAGDAGGEALRQLDIVVEPIEPATLGSIDLSRFTSIVLGPRAYESHEAVVRSNARLLDYVRRGGNLVVQYGAQDMNRFAVTPFPLQWTRPAARVTMETAPVTVLQPDHPLLTSPNRIGERDWADWVQERATYMPSAIDPRYTTLLAMHDPNEAEQRGGLLVTNIGRGRYVYVTLALFRQLPAGVPGAARLLTNLVSAPPVAVPAAKSR